MNFIELQTGFTPFNIAAEEALSLLDLRYGLGGKLERLGGERDCNFHVDSGCGRQLVLKISGAAGSQEAVDLQAQLLNHIARSSCRGLAPVGIPTQNGELYFEHQFDNGQRGFVRLVTCLEGTLMRALLCV